MSWNKLAPIIKTTGRPMASAALVVNKDGVPKISLILADSLHKDYSDARRCDVSAGEGEHEGSLLIEFAETGAFEATVFAKGGCRIFVPIGPGVPDKPATNQPCVLGERTAESLVLQLPVATWAEEIAARLNPARRATPQERVEVKAPTGPEPKGDTRLDVVEYLTGKGVKISRLAGERFMLNGETGRIGAVLQMVNRYRKAADLDPLSQLQVR